MESSEVEKLERLMQSMLLARVQMAPNRVLVLRSCFCGNQTHDYVRFHRGDEITRCRRCGGERLVPWSGVAKWYDAFVRYG